MTLMDVNDNHTVVKKPPRKPRPSEIAAKKAKAAAAKKKKAPKPKAKKKAKPLVKAAYAKVKKAKAKKSKNGRPLVRTERLDMRATPKQKAAIRAKAKREKRTVTSILQEALAKVAGKA